LRYSLWSRGRLLGHTDLDLDTHQSRFIHGFVEQTSVGDRVLPDATGVVAVCARRPRRRSDFGFDEEYLRAFQAAVDRREALDLVIRDQDDNVFECDFIRVYDLRDTSYQERVAAEADDFELEALESETGDGSDTDDLAELEDELEAQLQEDLALRAESEMYGSSWEPPEDERWETMKYYVQVFLKVSDDALLGP
jgi:hypothetical protein